jgi:hypothetical protein
VEIASGLFSGSQNFEVASGFLEKLRTALNLDCVVVRFGSPCHCDLRSSIVLRTGGPNGHSDVNKTSTEVLVCTAVSL